MATEKFSVAGVMPKGSKLETISIKAPEDPDDKKHRLRKEFWLFLVKDLGAYFVSFGFLIAIARYCGFVMVTHGVTSAEAKMVLPLLTSLFGGVVGLIIGKAAQ